MKSLFISIFSKKSKFYQNIKNIVGYNPGDVFLYEKALVHKSAVHDSSTKFKESNERLEFLGDAVLGAIVADYLFQLYPEGDEGFLTKMRSKIVSRQSLNSLAKKIKLDDLIIAKLDKNSKTDSIFGNAFEALIGAIYLDKGMKASEDFIIKKIIEPYISFHKLENVETNFKSRVIEWAQKQKIDLVFDIVSEIGEGRSKQFEAIILIDGEKVAVGKEKSKKKAEQIAAKMLCEQMDILNG